jgi:secreted Zn-dependent insulinase-like peptidase
VGCLLQCDRLHATSLKERAGQLTLSLKYSFKDLIFRHRMFIIKLVTNFSQTPLKDFKENKQKERRKNTGKWKINKWRKQ